MKFDNFIKNSNDILGFLIGLVLLLFAAGLAGTILARMWNDKINLSLLISESDGKASMSRLQLLVFTFVIALSLFFIVVSTEKPAFPPISDQILVLLGISGSTALVSKAIQTGSGTARAGMIISPATADVAPGATITLNLSLSNVPPGTAMPSVIWSLDAPAHGKLTPQLPDKVVYEAPPAASAIPSSETKVTVRAKAAGFEDGTTIVTLT